MLFHNGIPHRDTAHFCLVVSAVAYLASMNHIRSVIGARKALGGGFAAIPKALLRSG